MAVTSTTTTTPEAWSPNVVSSFNADDKLSEALLIGTSTKAGTIEGDEPQLLVPWMASDPAADFVDEGEPIELADIEAAQLAISTYKIAVVTKVSRELVTQDGAAGRIADSLKRSITAKMDSAYLRNATSPTGLLEIAGIDTAGDLATNVWDIHTGIAAIQADGGEPSDLLINPSDWAHLAKLPTATGSNQSLLSDVHEAGQRTIAGVKVTVHSAVTEGTALLLDRNEIISAYSTLDIARSEDAFFVQDAVALRAVVRVGWGVVRPARLQKLTVTKE